MEVDERDRDVVVPILARERSLPGRKLAIASTPTHHDKGAPKQGSRLLLLSGGGGGGGGGEPLDEHLEDQSKKKKAKKIEEAELHRDLLHIAILLVISGAVVALNLLGMLVTIPGIRGSITPQFFTIGEIQKLAVTLSTYTEQHFVRMLTVQVLLGTWVQTFIIPGATVLNILAGNNFGMAVGLATTMFCNTLGCTFLYLISRSVGRRIVKRYLHDRLEGFRKIVQSRTGAGGGGKEDEGVSRLNLCIYLTSLRVFPFTPNWFLNVALASLEVPLSVFLPSLVLGLLPYNYLQVQAGLLLHDLTSIKVVDASVTVQLGAIATMGLTLPSIVRRVNGCLNKKEQAQTPTVDYYWKQAQKGQRDEK